MTANVAISRFDYIAYSGGSPLTRFFGTEELVNQQTLDLFPLPQMNKLTCFFNWCNDVVSKYAVIQGSPSLCVGTLSTLRGQ